MRMKYGQLAWITFLFNWVSNNVFIFLDFFLTIWVTLLRKIFGLKKDKVIGKWTRLLNKECHRLHSSSKYNSRGQIKKNGMALYMTGIVEGRGVYRVTVVRCGERDNSENVGVEGMILKWKFRRSVGCVDWIDLAQDRDNWRAFAKTILNFLILQNEGCFLTCWGNIGFSGRTLPHRVN